MESLVFATHNQHKLAEIKAMLNSKFNLKSLTDIGCTEEIVEDGISLDENAQIKANYVFTNYQLCCFADDTGLEVEALSGAPGVISARYAGKQKNSEDNMNKLLLNLASKENRRARFRTIICLKTEMKTLFFEGICEGKIIEIKKGKMGFGYDPIFVPKGYDKTFAELSSEEKNKISHRGLAFQKLIHYLNENSIDVSH